MPLNPVQSARQLARPLKRRLQYPNWRGYCPICEQSVRFYAHGLWYRDQLLCGDCKSIPRQRAIMATISAHFPNWRELQIHESSPGRGAITRKLRAECPGYVDSQYDRSIPLGSRHPDHTYVSQDLEAQTFPDESFDIVLSQDVFEHLFRPDLAIREIARTLRPGGANIMTAPLVNKAAPSQRRASLINGEIVHHLPAEYHGNPIDPNGSLVTVDWGYDIAEYLSAASGLSTVLYSYDDHQRGLCAEYLEVIGSWKRPPPAI